MKDMDTNTIIATSLAIMGNLAIIGWVILSYAAGTSTGTEIPIAIIGNLGGVLTGKQLTEKKYEGWTPPPEKTEPEGSVREGHADGTGKNQGN